MEKGTLAKWLVAEGDLVKAGDLLAEIETDKATMEYEAVDEGRIAQLVVAEGTDDVAVGSVIALLAGVDDAPPHRRFRPPKRWRRQPPHRGRDPARCDARGRRGSHSRHGEDVSSERGLALLRETAVGTGDPGGDRAVRFPAAVN
eukprot:gene4006-5122_t